MCTILQVEFDGESGIGSGVHVSFFTDAAAALEARVGINPMVTSEKKRLSMIHP
jgi:hypothetical protein